MHTVLGSLLLALAGLGTGFAAEGESAPHGSDWVQKKVQTCASCHGEKGVSKTPNFPIIAGQYQDYLYHSLVGYRDGERKNAIMSGQVQGLTNAQLEALAAYYAEQASPLHTPALN